MIKRIIYFYLVLAVLLLLSFFIHKTFLVDYEVVLFKSYLLNYIMAILVYTLLVLASKRFSTQLGFLYMAGSFLKFILFFIFLNPTYKTLDINPKSLFFMFFVPYSIALILETKLLANMLNKD